MKGSWLGDKMTGEGSGLGDNMIPYDRGSEWVRGENDTI